MKLVKLTELEQRASITILPCALEDSRPVLKFVVSISGNGHTETFDYGMGCGHIDQTKGPNGGFRNLFERNRHATPTDKQKWLGYVQACQDRQKVKPHLADVLDCLFIDSSACGESFDNWSADYGYNSDSIKALEIYRACQRNGDKLRKVLGADYEALEEIVRELND
jgi:hypothetical protein